MGVAATIGFDHDPVADAVYIRLRRRIGPGDVTRSIPCDIELDQAAIVADFDADGCLVGIEVVGASRLLPPELLGESAPE